MHGGYGKLSEPKLVFQLLLGHSPVIHDCTCWLHGRCFCIVWLLLGNWASRLRSRLSVVVWARHGFKQAFVMLSSLIFVRSWRGKKRGLTGCANEWILDLQAHAVRQDAHFDYFLLSRSRPVHFKHTTGSSCLEGNITSCGGLHFSSFLLFWAIGTVCQCHWGRERHPGKLVLARWSHIVNEVINGWEWGSQCKVKWCYMHVCVWLQLTFLFFFSCTSYVLWSFRYVLVRKNVKSVRVL